MDDDDLKHLQSLLDQNRAVQELIRRHLQSVDSQLRHIEQLRKAEIRDRPPICNQAVFSQNPLKDDHGYAPPVSREQKCFEVIKSLIPFRHAPANWTCDERVNLCNGVIHQNRVLLTGSVLKEGDEFPSGPERTALIRAKLDAIRDMSPEQLLLNTNSIDWNSISLTHVRSKTGTDCQIQWMCNDDPRINRRQEWNETEDQALLELHEKKYHGFEWVKTASELETHRTAMHCLQRYKFLQTKRQGDFWTDEQDLLLKRLVDQFGCCYWSQVALFFPNRTGLQCQARYSNALQDWIRGGKWSPDESQRLKLAFEAYGPKWSRIAQHVPGRTQTKCRERYFNQYETGAVTGKRQRFTAEEDAELLRAVEEIGEGNWARIAARLKGRSDSQYRRRYARIVAKRKKLSAVEEM